MQTKNINIQQEPLNNEVSPQKMLIVNQSLSIEVSQHDDVPPLPPRGVVIFSPIPSVAKPQVEVEGHGPYKPVPPPKPLPQQNSTSAPPPPYRMPPYPLFNEPSIPGATGLESSSVNLTNSQGLQTHSSKFPIEREVILSSADKNSKIPILQEYKKRSKSAIAPDIPPKQMAAWTQAQRQMTLQSQVLNPDQIHPTHTHQTQQNNLHNGADQTGLYRSPYLSVSEFYNGQNTGAVPRSTWQGGDIRPSPAPRQYQQNEENQTNSPNVAISIETSKDNNQKDISKGSKSVTKTYHTIKDLISNRFRSGKDNSDEKMDEPGLNNVTDELRKSARSIDRLGDEFSDDHTNNFKKTAGEQGIYGKPRTEPNINIQQHHHYNQQMIQQHILSQQASQSRQTIQQYQLAQQLKGQPQNFYPNHQLTQARSQEILAPCTPEQIYYQSSYGSAPQRPVQRYGMSQGSEQNYILMHHSQLDERELPNDRFVDDRRTTVEKRSAQQLERDNLRQRSFEARRTASQPQLICDDEVNADMTNHTHQQVISAHARRGSHGNLIETIGAANEENEKDSDDGGFLKRNTDRLEKEGELHLMDSNTELHTTDTQESSGYNDSKVSDALMGSPRKRLEGEIGRIEGVYNIGQRPIKPKTEKDMKKMTGESGASSDYDKPGQSSSNADSGRGSAAYSSGRRPGTKSIHESPELQRNKANFKDLYHSSQDSEWVDVVENELRTILEPKLHELSLQGNSVGISNSTLSESISSMTPPLPPLSPGDQSSPNLTPRNSTKFKKHSSLPYGSKPDYGHEMYNKLHKGHTAGPGRWSNATPQKQRNKKTDHNSAFRGKQAFGFDNTDITSTTTRSLDLESMLDNQSDSEGDISTTDARAIRKQLESLEGMYSEVLKILGVKKYMGRYQPSDPRFSKRRYGSMSSLPSSSVSSRPIRDKRRANEDRKKVKDIRGINKRFQRLESHVVTLARSVAHLSSEMRTQHLMIQEMETIRSEISALRTQTNMLNVRSQSATRAANGSKDLPSLTNPTRVKKLTKFFGDEPPLLRLFLRKLGYEKYANVFENERVGMVELPYLSEERLQKMGVPLGPRLRILQEAQISVCKDTTLCIV